MEVNLFNSFSFWNVTSCDSPDNVDSIDFTIFKNGSVRLHEHDATYAGEDDGGYHICITANVNACYPYFLLIWYKLAKLQGTLAVVIICTHKEEVNDESIAYSVFFAISIVFLAFTLVAFFVAPEMQNLQGKSIASQSAYLMIAYVALILTHLQVSTDEVFCKILGIKNAESNIFVSLSLMFSKI